jgi:alpha-amylase
MFKGCTGVIHWWDNGDKMVAFGRGGKGFIAFNNQLNTNMNANLQVNMTNKSTF